MSYATFAGVVLCWLWLGALTRGWWRLRQLLQDLHELERRWEAEVSVSGSERQHPLE